MPGKGRQIRGCWGLFSLATRPADALIPGDLRRGSRRWLVYRMLYWGQDYVDVGEAAYEERYRQRTLAHLKTTAKDLGYQLVPNTAFPTIRGPISAPTA